MKFPKGFEHPFLARSSLDDEPFPHVEIAPFLHVYHYPFDGQKMVDALEADGALSNWDQAKVGPPEVTRVDKHRDSRAKSFGNTEIDNLEADIDTYTELQKASYPNLYHAQRAIWAYRLHYDLHLRDCQGWTVNKYGHGGQYKSHVDHGTADPRVISCVLYLNTVEDGGKTCFTYQNVSSDCIAGNILVFPSSYIYSHASEPTGFNSGEVKYSMAAFFI